VRQSRGHLHIRPSKNSAFAQNLPAAQATGNERSISCS
jgi:hypothetical protein